MGSDPVRARLDHWQRQLVDLTRRNRLLNYKPTPVTTIRVIEEQPSEVFRLLFNERRALHFQPLPARQQKVTPPLVMLLTGVSDLDASDVDVALLSAARPVREKPVTAEFAAYEREQLPKHQVDELLQTTLLADKLDLNLLRIFQSATGLLEDQGVNSLFLALGMLRWYESDSSEVALDAPLILLPVMLGRQTLQSAFTLKASGDDPLINPALVEKLRLDFRIVLPVLPEVVEDFDPAVFFTSVQAAVARRGRWQVTNAIELGLFTFQKFVMYRAMTDHAAQLAAHPVIQALATGRGERVRQLPGEIRDAQLDAVFIPEATSQVLDADSSQQRALLAVSKGFDLALEGPPGTGKSQTIANLIAAALARGQQVLFVSEKMAALRVVHGRLSALGLHDFCLELHSNKANKRAVVEELARVLDGPRVADHAADGQLQRLADLRSDLNGYDEDLHTPLGHLGQSPFAILGAFEAVADAPALNVSLTVGHDLDEYDEARFAQLCRDLRDHTAILHEIGDPALDPWRGSTRRAIGDLERDRLEEALGRATSGLDWLRQEVVAFAAQLGAVEPRTLGQVEILCDVANSLAASPRTNEDVLRNERWNTLSSEVSELLARGEQYVAARAIAHQHALPTAFAEEIAPLHEQFAALVSKRMYRLRPSYRRTRKALRVFLTPEGQALDDAALLTVLETLARCRLDAAFLQSQDAAGQSLFGARWCGPKSDWRDLRQFADWIVGVRRLVVAEALADKGLTLAAQGGIDAAAVRERAAVLRQAHAAIRQEISHFCQFAAFTPQPDLGASAEMPIAPLRARLNLLWQERTRLRSWVFYQDSIYRCATGLAGPFVARFEAERLPIDALEPAFRRLLYRHWLDWAAGMRPRFAQFQTLRHEQKVAEFKQLDRHALTLSRQRTLHHLCLERDRRLAEPDLAAETTLVQRQYRMRARHLPLRQLLKRAPRAVRAIKPCLMMSPLSVAQYLDPELHQFDLVVFDEASQIAPPDAIGAILHGKQIIVVGDTKQLPPTNFFSAQITAGDEQTLGDDGEGAIIDDVESILDDFVASGFPRERLKWHYRSKHESLIAFSNRHFYDGELLTFPGPDTSTRERGLRFEWVGGVYEGKGVNPIEAHAVADAVCEHARAQPHLSLGVGTFNVRQQTLIQDELERRRKQDPAIEPFFSLHGEERFFVKNLENIQGDERDVIFLSITYGPDAEGRVRYNFGPINGDNGRRRLNVIATRARLALHVFSSLRAEQIDLTRARSDGAQRLRDYLLFAERGTLATLNVDPEAEMDSPFEEAVYKELTQRGLRLVPQVGQAGYRIDFGVLDNAVAGRFIAGIECDGATYHSAATARDRDRLRQQVLESLGWHIHRIWSTDWYRDRVGQIERILRLVEGSRRAAQEAAPPTLRSGVAPEAPGEASETVSAGNMRTIAAEEPELENAPVVAQPVIVPPRAQQEPITPYRFTAVHIVGTAEEFHLATDEQIAQVLVQVIKDEAPIHLAEATKRVALHWQATRAGSRIRERVQRVAMLLARRGQLTLRDEFLWIDAEQVAIVRSRAVEGYSFAAEYIALEEYQAAVVHLLRLSGPMLRNEVVVGTARLLGFDRAGAKLAERIAAAIQELVATGRLRLVAAGLQLVEET